MIFDNSSSSLIPDAVYAFSDGWQQAWQLAERCRAQLGECVNHTFPDGETLTTITPSTNLQGRVVAIYRSLHHPNQKLVELMLAAGALPALGAKTLLLIAPYMPYMRQDRAFVSGQAISQKIIGDFLANIFDGVITVQPHLHRTKAFAAVFGGKIALDIPAGRAFGLHMRRSGPPTIVVGPDEESEDLVRAVVEVTGAKWFTAIKQRRGDNDVSVSLPGGTSLEGADVTIVDDIISSGGTIATLARALKSAGAGDISVYAAHAMFDSKAALLMHHAGVSSVKSVSTVPHETNVIDVVELICGGLGVSK